MNLTKADGLNFMNCENCKRLEAELIQAQAAIESAKEATFIHGDGQEVRDAVRKVCDDALAKMKEAK